MCGLAGMARIDGGALDPESDAIVSAMARLVAHRGPDGREMMREGPVALAFTRLSLVDPERGGQPLVSDDGSLVLICNGEVYNHRELAAGLPSGTRLRTGSDCEVLLYLYREHGTAFLDRVRGMFGLVLWDRRRNRLVLARDRFGIKPLYYHRSARRLVFSSEIKALFADPGTPRQLDWEAALTSPMLSAAPYLRETSPSTWFAHVDYVPAGGILQIDLRDGTTREHRYWQFPAPAGSHGTERTGTGAQLIASYGELLASSVAECATADAELGLFLSGGVDSAAVAALASRHAKPLHTFTALSAATYRNGDAGHGNQVAEFLDLPNHQVVFDADRVPGVAEWRRLLWLLETPQCGPEQFYKHELHRYAKDTRPELRGMLLGAASDEFNGGYSSDYAGGGDWSHFETNVRGMVRQGALHDRPSLTPWWNQLDLPVLTDQAVGRFTGANLVDPYHSYVRHEYVKVQQYNCWHEDRTAAGSGIEARVPFLDHRLVELSMAIPPAGRRELLWDKRILREAVRELLPPGIVRRAKVPFFYGPGEQYTYRAFARMLAQSDGALLEEALSAPDARAFLDPAGMRAMVRRFADGPATSQVQLLLPLVNLGLLARMVADLPPPIVDTPAGPSPRATPFPVDEAGRAEVERRLGCYPRLSPELVVRPAEGVLFLHPPADPSAWFIVVDGTVEYVLAGEEDEPARRFLLAVGEGRTLGEILAGLELDLRDLHDFLVDAIEQRVLLVA
jgi:asparagine synthase (glutamine-hydrolysing)